MAGKSQVVRITGLEAMCPICHAVTTFREYTREEDHYRHITGQLKRVFSCEHYVNAFKDHSWMARFYKDGKDAYWSE